MACSECGHLQFNAEEMSEGLRRCHMANIELHGSQNYNKTEKKLKLVTKETSPHILVDHFKHHLFLFFFLFFIFLNAGAESD